MIKSITTVLENKVEYNRNRQEKYTNIGTEVANT